ncbi:MAG: hypothetical protein JW857_03440 [Bacteroidales bacterium]|nr:hypothetical protein [Bacteroidales bacterium]
MKRIIALFGWKYVKDQSNGRYHYYNCPNIKAIQNREICNKLGMKEDLARHPYSVTTANCLEGIV